jgi:hypothetical protein
VAHLVGMSIRQAIEIAVVAMLCLFSTCSPNRVDTESNQAILDRVEALGGGYVWEPEVFAVILGKARTDEEVAVLQGLAGVQQIALNATSLSFPTLEAVARIPGLESLVLGGARLTDRQLAALQGIGPEIELVDVDSIADEP